MASISSPVTRFGGKGHLWQWIIPHFPRDAVKRYVEECGGGANVLLNIDPPYPFEIYNDIDGELLVIFRVLRDSPEELARALYFTPYSKPEYDFCAAPITEDIDDVERARRYIVAHRQGFGGKGSVRAGWCRSKDRPKTVRSWVSFAEEKFGPIVERFRNVQVDGLDGIECFRLYDQEGTLHYLDPPYMVESRQRADEYGDLEVTCEWHEELLEAILGAEGMVAISGYHTALYDNALSKWQCGEKRTRISAARYGYHELADDGWRIECLWLNPALVEAKRVETPQLTLWE